MRQLKFRAWIKDGGWNDEGTEQQYIMTYALAFEIDELLNNGAFLMQYVGWVDLNGKLIYESDILRDEHGSIGVVIWDRYLQGYPCFCIEWNDGDTTGFDDAAHLDYEVIGNTFENPELVTNVPKQD